MSLFVSYSHKDRNKVFPMVSLLRLNGDVFLDRDSIQPGGKWRDQLKKAIGSASKFLVFWSSNSADSMEVQFEYENAIFFEKDVVPILLDATPLAKPLSEYQWINFNEATPTQCPLPRLDQLIPLMGWMGLLPCPAEAPHETTFFSQLLELTPPLRPLLAPIASSNINISEIRQAWSALKTRDLPEQIKDLIKSFDETSKIILKRVSATPNKSLE